MNIELILLTLFTMISAVGLSGVNFEKIIKKNKVIEVRILAIILSISFGYLVTSFVLKFLNI